MRNFGPPKKKGGVNIFCLFLLLPATSTTSTITTARQTGKCPTCYQKSERGKKKQESGRGRAT